MKTPELLVKLTQEWDQMDSDARRGPRGQEIKHDIELIGIATDHVGGFDAMTRLHNQAEALVGNDNSVGFYLNSMWDGIGGWAS
jgi:hypothetical protein